MAASAANGVQREVDKQFNTMPTPTPTPTPALAQAATAASTKNSVLPALSDRRPSGPPPPAAHRAVPQKPAAPTTATTTATTTIAATAATTTATAATRPTGQPATGKTPAVAGPVLGTFRQATPQDPTQQRVSTSASNAAVGRPANGLQNASSTGPGSGTPHLSLFKGVAAEGHTGPAGSSGTSTPMQAPRTLSTPTVSNASNSNAVKHPQLATFRTASPSPARPAAAPLARPSALPPKPPTVAAVHAPAPTTTATPTSTSLARNGNPTPISSSLHTTSSSTPTPPSAAPQPTPQSTSQSALQLKSDGQPAPRPAYKMKRTGRPGMLPPASMNSSGSRTPTPSGSTPTRTPTYTPSRDGFNIKTQPPPQPQSRLFARTSPGLVLIESDLLPKAQQQHTTTPSTNGQPNGVKRPRESVAGIVNLAQPAQKRAKSARRSGSSEDGTANPVTMTISLSSEPEDSSDSDSDGSSDSSDSSDDEAEDAVGPENSVVLEGEDDSSSLSEEGEVSEDDEDDDENDDENDADDDDVDDSIEVGDDEAVAVLTSAAPETYANAPSGRPYNKFEEQNGNLTSTKGAIIPDGYKQWHDRVTPWICPIRSCRRLFPELVSMGGHFSRGHRASNINDNLDGTLTVVKRLTSQSVRIGARVVSQRTPAKLEKLAKPRPSSSAKRIAAANAERLAKQDRQRNKNKERRRLEAASRLQNKPGQSLTKATTSTTSTPSAPVPTKELLFSASGREYTKYLNGDLNFGVLFPDGYKQSSYPKMPWVCPVRDCQRVLPAIVNLGGHFTRKHRHTLFNDNGDGTLSKVGMHPQMRAFVVSTIKRPASEMEPLAPQMPAGYQPRGAEPVATPPSTQKTQKTTKTATPVSPSTKRPVAKSMDLMIAPPPGPRDLPKPLPVDKQATWDYIQPFLAPSLRKPAPPSSGYSSLYLACPRVRSLKLNERRKKAAPNGELFGMSSAAALIQLSGDYVSTPCDHCKSGRGLYEGCVIVSSKGNADMNVAYSKCANCVERRNNDKCSLLPIFRPRFAKLFPSLNYDTTYRYARSGNFGYVELAASLGLQRLTSQHADIVRRERVATKSSAVEKTNTGGGGGGSSGSTRGSADPSGGGGSRPNKYRDPDPASSDNEPLARGALRRGGSSLAPTPQAGFHHEQDRVQLTPDAHDRRRSGRIADKDGSMVSFVAQTKQTSSSMALTRTHATDSGSSLVFAGNVQPGPEALEMEDWEVAPGRVQTETHENIAFSNAYLTSNQMVPIDHNMSYRVEVVRPGQTVSFDPESQAMRMCTLASGKLKVAVGDDRFTMGPHGMFKVKPGTSFLVENRLYIDAYLHITVLHNVV